MKYFVWDSAALQYGRRCSRRLSPMQELLHGPKKSLKIRASP